MSMKSKMFIKQYWQIIIALEKIYTYVGVTFLRRVYYSGFNVISMMLIIYLLSYQTLYIF